MKKHILILEPANRPQLSRTRSLQQTILKNNALYTTSRVHYQSREFYRLVKEHAVTALPSFLVFKDRSCSALVDTYTGITTYPKLAKALHLKQLEEPSSRACAYNFEDAIESACNS